MLHTNTLGMGTVKNWVAHHFITKVDSFITGRQPFSLRRNEQDWHILLELKRSQYFNKNATAHKWFVFCRMNKNNFIPLSIQSQFGYDCSRTSRPNSILPHAWVIFCLRLIKLKHFYWTSNNNLIIKDTLSASVFDLVS